MRAYLWVQGAKTRALEARETPPSFRDSRSKGAVMTDREMIEIVGRISSIPRNVLAAIGLSIIAPAAPVQVF